MVSPLQKKVKKYIAESPDSIKAIYSAFNIVSNLDCELEKSSGWYIPSGNQMKTLNRVPNLNKLLIEAKGTIIDRHQYKGIYWTANEVHKDYSAIYDFYIEAISHEIKSKYFTRKPITVTVNNKKDTIGWDTTWYEPAAKLRPVLTF